MRVELHVYLAVLIHMGLHIESSIEEYWHKDFSYGCRPRSDFLTAVLPPSYRRRTTVFDAYQRLSTVFEAYHLMTHHLTTYDPMSYSLFLLPVLSLCI